MRVMVTGAAGQVGTDLVRHCTEMGDEVWAVDLAQFDICERDQVHGAITSVAPDLVVNCAAWTAVDACESDPQRAYAINALAVRNIREACGLVDAHLVHISTDYVFDGTSQRPYHEWDTPSPRSVYGQTKLAGEREVGLDATVVRTSWVCGEYGPNMVRTVLQLAGTTDRLSFVDDQRGCPTFAADLVVMLRRLGVERRSGVHHVTNQGAVSWYEFVREILRVSGHDPDMVTPITTADLSPPRPAPRPANSVLENAVLTMSGIGLLRDFREPLAELVARLA
jgi:dTDP-4-dehydrorhamnose reductase